MSIQSLTKMRILFDITHPAHAHFFRHPMALLHEAGHEVLVTSRPKDVTLDLLNAWDIPHRILKVHHGRGAAGLLWELVSRDRQLMRVVRDFRPDCMAAIGGTFIAHVGYLMGIPSLVFYDTENARLQNAITYPFADCVFAPRCYQAWLPNRRHVRYPGYHELSYLHPKRFTPDRDIALENGLDPEGSTFLIRLVAWEANHDIGEEGWSPMLLRKVLNHLSPMGRVLISTEAPLPAEFHPYIYTGHVNQIHHLMAFCKGFIGESATMASESSVLGVPAIYAANTGRGYTDEQESRYGLVKNVRHLLWSDVEPAIAWLFALSANEIHRNRERLLNETIDVAAYVANVISTYPSALERYHEKVGI